MTWHEELPMTQEKFQLLCKRPMNTLEIPDICRLRLFRDILTLLTSETQLHTIDLVIALQELGIVLSPSSVRQHLQMLKSSGVVGRHAVGMGDLWFRIS